MAIRKPNLDELDVTLDAFVGSFDSDSDLLKADATLTNLTLDELDAFVSNFDALDTFGNVETNYSFSIKNMSADVTAAVTIQAELVFSIPFDASASLAVTATADAKRVKDFAASASVAATATATSLRQRLADASVSAVASAIANGTLSILASVSAIKVLPHPVGPISKILLLESSTSSSFFSPT